MGPPYPDLLGGAASGGRVTTVTLGGLDEEAVAELVAGVADREVDDEARALARALHADTAGNPLFVREVVRDLLESGAGLSGRGGPSPPASVGVVVRQRLDRLSEATVRLLGLAAVMGAAYDLEVLRVAAGLEEDEVLAALDEAGRAGLIHDAAGSRQRFTHGLVKDVVYGALPAARRASLHRRVAEAVEVVHGAHLDDHLPDLARHFARAGEARAATGIRYAARAAERAMAQLSYDEAVGHLRQALALLDLAAPADPGLRADLLLGLGDAQRRRGDPEHRETLLAAAAAAAELGDAERLARAALANGRGFWSASGTVDQARVDVLAAALGALDRRDTPLRAQLLGHLAVELVWAGDLAQVRALSDEALAMARRLGDVPTLVAVLLPRYNALRGDPGTLPERLADTAELLAVAEQLPDPSLRCQAWGWRAVALLEAADVAEAERCFEVFDRLAAELRQPTLLWYSAYLRACRLLLAGRFQDAEQASFEAFQLGQAAGHPDAEMFLLAQGIQLAYERGSLGDWEGGLLGDIGRQPGSDLFLRSWQAVLLCELDRDDEARRGFEALAAADFADFAFEPTWLHIVGNCALVCAHLGDRRRAGLLAGLLAPYRDQLVTICSLACTGAVEHHLGLLAATAGDRAAANSHFASAAATHERIGAPAWLARTRLEWARALLATSQGRPEEAAGLLDQALTAAGAVGALTVERRSKALLAAATG